MTTIAMPCRISTLRYAVASIAARIGLEKEPEHMGADSPGWEQEIRNMRLDRPTGRHAHRPTDIPTAVVKPVRQPIAAIAATPHREIDDEHLGVLRVASLEPARIFDHLTGGTR